MNSSSSSSNSSYGVSNLSETNHVLGFNSPAISSGSNVTRSRVMKSRKQTSGYNHNKFNKNSLLDRGLGFSQFRSPYDSDLYGVNSDVILDDMSKLKIDSGKDYCNVSKDNGVVNSKSVDELPISKLKIEGESNVESVKDSQVTGFVNNKGNVAVELQNEMKKMNIKEPADVSSESNNVKSSVYDGSNLQSFGSASFTSKSEKMAEFAFTSKLGDIGAPSYVEFKTPDMRSNMFSGLNRFEARKEFFKDSTRSKKKKGKLKTPVVGQSRVREDFRFHRRSLSGNSDTFEAYSPMDISPCDEKLADRYSRETSVTSEEGSLVNEQINVSSESHIMTSNVTTDDEVCETESFKSANENLENSSDTFVTALDSDVSSTATSGMQESVFNFASKSENISKGKFTFAAFSSSQSQLPSDTRLHKKKLPLKIVRDSYNSASAELFPISGNSSLLSPGNGPNVDLSTSRKKKDNIKLVNEQDYRHETVFTSSSSKLAEEACEKWRLRCETLPYIVLHLYIYIYQLTVKC